MESRSSKQDLSSGTGFEEGYRGQEGIVCYDLSICFDYSFDIFIVSFRVQGRGSQEPARSFKSARCYRGDLDFFKTTEFESQGDTGRLGEMQTTRISTSLPSLMPRARPSLGGWRREREVRAVLGQRREVSAVDAGLSHYKPAACESGPEVFDECQGDEGLNGIYKFETEQVGGGTCEHFGEELIRGMVSA